MPYNPRVLVVGTTGDYIQWIYQHYPHRAVFLTDSQVRKNAKEDPPDLSDEVLANLTDFTESETKLLSHLNQWNLQLTGVTCFDDESLELAAILAKAAGLPFTSTESIRSCRSKLESKIRWKTAGIPCADYHCLSLLEIDNYQNNMPFPCVAKPLTGSGSELVFRCDNNDELSYVLNILRKGLKKRNKDRLFSSSVNNILIEEFIEGNEYSCDFMINSKQLQIIRLSSKIFYKQTPMTGTVMGYFVPASLPDGMDTNTLKQILQDAVNSLEISNALCMADFIIRQGQIVLLEISPRPGGDCHPNMLRWAANIDMLKIALDFAVRGHINIPEETNWKSMAALRFHAAHTGTLRTVESHELTDNTYVKEISIYRSMGEVVQLPPEDYSSWLIGHVIFEPSWKEPLDSQIIKLRQKLNIVMEPQLNE